MSIRAEIETRISEQCWDHFNEIAGAADLNSILAGRVSAPGAYIFRLANAAAENTRVNAISQRIQESYAVVVVTRNVRDKGRDSSDESEALCDLISNCLLGWEPASAEAPITYTGGKLITLRDDILFWQEVYKTARYIRA